jgi:medium-chain acyl-[acyl-carrier-protein] hydrolase
MALQQFEKDFQVHVYETGPDGRINLHSLFNYMQDVASEHAVALGYGRDELMKENHFWVLSRMYARITAWPSWNEIVKVRTWPSGVDKMFAMRNYEIRTSNGTEAVTASSSWLIIDRTTKRIQRPDEFLQRYNKDNQSIIAGIRNPAKIPEASAEGTLSPLFKVKINDLDINLHTNNVNYIKWVTDTYDLNFVMNHQVCSAEINYLAEAVYSDEISIRTSSDETDNRFFYHSVSRKTDQKELCRVKLEWEEMKNKLV